MFANGSLGFNPAIVSSGLNLSSCGIFWSDGNGNVPVSSHWKLFQSAWMVRRGETTNPRNPPLTLTTTCNTITSPPIWGTGGMLMWGMVKSESLGVSDGLRACVQMLSWLPSPSRRVTRAGCMYSRCCWETRPAPRRQGESWAGDGWRDGGRRGGEGRRCHSQEDIHPEAKIKYRLHTPQHNCSDKSIILTSVSRSLWACVSLTNCAESCKCVAHWEKENVARKKSTMCRIVMVTIAHPQPTPIIPTPSPAVPRRRSRREFYHARMSHVRRGTTMVIRKCTRPTGDIPPQLASIFV